MKARRVYFFDSTRYTRFESAINGALPVYPLDTASRWHGLPARIDAAVNWGNGKVYFFSGNQYYRYDTRVDGIDPGYPKPITIWFSGASADFANGIDAAVNWGNGKAYFFRGDQYVRYDMSDAVDSVEAGYPKPIAGNWGGVGVGSTFASGIGDIVNYGNGKVYWFKGDQYARFDLGSKGMDADYPKPIAGNWPGVFTTGIAAAVEWPMALVDTFNVHTGSSGCVSNVTGGSRFIGETFNNNIDYKTVDYPVTAAVGEYRQYVRGTFTWSGTAITHLLMNPSGGAAPAMSATTFQEDGVHQSGSTPLAGIPGLVFWRYGHRMDPQANNIASDQFTGPDRPTGRSYRGWDGPGWTGAAGSGVSCALNLDFRGDAVDAAHADLVLQTVSWTVNCSGVM